MQVAAVLAGVAVAAAVSINIHISSTKFASLRITHHRREKRSVKHVA
jgi:hypothetical protein